MTNRLICVHGHFYQPPRENPWLDAVEPQPSAHPYPDWNARITAECYRPNAVARIVDDAGRIIDIVDNYARISFDVGPTLMSWLEREATDVHAAIIAADRASQARFGGHGSAMAQAYNHLIMPLASRRDQVTQARWGIRDFQQRFGRAPVGMWLPECAVDVTALEVLAAEGIEFTVLAPYQARRVRPMGPNGSEWSDVGEADPGRLYRCRLPSGRSIDVFFYDGQLSRAVAFERLLSDGGRLAARLVDCGNTDQGVVLRHIATDGETYGHHHRYGDMALAWALTSIDRGDHVGAELTNYAQFRALHPASWEVEIREDTSWSCAHGTDRWRADCGCASGGNPGWNQAWRRPLREALDWLRDRASEVLATMGAEVFRDPWAARDAYIDVLLDGGRREEFLAHHGLATLDAEGRVRALKLMELSRHAMLMYTSCGWFFDDLAGIETVQILQYAARVCELVVQVGGHEVERGFVDRLALAESNRADSGDGRRVWCDQVVPARVDLRKVVAHYAVMQVVDDGDVAAETVYCYRVEPYDVVRRRTGKARLLAGAARCVSGATGEVANLVFAVLHLGEHHFLGGVRPVPKSGEWPGQVRQLTDSFLAADHLAAQRLLDSTFAGATFSLGSLFGRERGRMLDTILANELRDADAVYRGLYDEYGPLMRYLARYDLPIPLPFAAAAELVLRRRILAELERSVPSFDDVRACIAEAAQVRVDLDTPEVAYAAGRALDRMIGALAQAPDVLALIEALARMAEIAVAMKSPVELWDAQNQAWRVRTNQLPGWRLRAASGDPTAARMVVAFGRLAHAIRVRIDP